MAAGKSVHPCLCRNLLLADREVKTQTKEGADE
jgi:hypothetical protein